MATSSHGSSPLREEGSPLPKKSRVMHNPYGKKASKPLPISQKPLYGETASSLTVSSSNLVETGQANKEGGDCSSTSRGFVDPDAESKTPMEPPQTPLYQGGPMSISLQPWQRLPSQTLSFGSAEILSVSECVQHAALYHQHGCSIRCTGAIQESLPDHPATGRIASCPPPCLSVRLSDPLHGVLSNSTSQAAATGDSPQLWIVFRTPEQTGTVRATRSGSTVTVLGEPLPLESGDWALQVRLCLPVPPTANLALQWQALLLRRRHLLATTTPEPDAVLRAGCGPPPYTSTS